MIQYNYRNNSFLENNKVIVGEGINIFIFFLSWDNTAINTKYIIFYYFLFLLLNVFAIHLHFYSTATVFDYMPIYVLNIIKSVLFYFSIYFCKLCFDLIAIKQCYLPIFVCQRFNRHIT